MKKVFRLGELFSGPGGLALGARSARVSENGNSYSIELEWANDYDKDTCETYRFNIHPIKPNKVICKDVHELDIPKLKPIDALAFGFPCNDFSIVGETKGTNGRFGPLYSYGVEALTIHQPEWFLAENVGGLRHSNEGKDFKMILNSMYDAGYDLYPNLYMFEKYGVPQARHRIIIIGIRKDFGLEFKIPMPTTENCPITCKEALEGNPIPFDAPNNELTTQSTRVVERLNYIKPGQNAFNSDIPEHLRLNVKAATLSVIYKRLDPDKPAYTITGSGGGGTHVYHWKENRALTNRERARLQTFPDNFIFSGSKESVRKQIGMAVPPLAAKTIFEAILKTMAGIEYDWVKPSMKPMVHEKVTLEAYDDC